MLSERQKKIVELILKYPQGANASIICDEVKVSTRTIRNDIASINIYLMNNHCMINSSKRVGYFILKDNVDKVKECLSIMNAIDHKQIAVSPMERKYYVLGQLLQFHELDLYDVSTFLYVSEQTVYKDLVSFQKMLKKKFHFESLKMENGKIILEGNEEELRTLFYRIVKEEIWLSNKLIDIHLYQLVKDMIDMEELYDIVDYISGYSKTNNINIPDLMLFIIAWMIIFTINRFDQNHLIITPIPHKNNNESLKVMLVQLLNDLHYEIGSEDMKLLENYMETLGLFSNQYSKLVVSDNIDIVSEFTKEMKHKYALNFESMPSLFENFKNHLEFAIKRLLMDYQLINPLLQEVKTKYSFAYEIAMLIVPLIYKKHHLYIQEDEISFLALYIQPFLKVQNTSINTLLVYGTTISFTSLMEAWIQQEFKERIKIIGYAPIYKVEEEIEHQNIDLIISNVPLEKKFKVPVIEIMQLPLESDRSHIENFISRQAMISASVSIFHKIFDAKRIVFVDDNLSYTGLLKFCAKMLEIDGKIEDSEKFVVNTISREKVYPTHIEHGCFMPHPLMNLALESSVCLAIIKGNIIQNEENVKLVFVIAFEPKIEPDLKYIYSLINTIATSEDLCNIILKMQDVNEIMDYLERIIQLVKV